MPNTRLFEWENDGKWPFAINCFFGYPIFSTKPKKFAAWGHECQPPSLLKRWWLLTPGAESPFHWSNAIPSQHSFFVVAQLHRWYSWSTKRFIDGGTSNRHPKLVFIGRYNLAMGLCLSWALWLVDRMDSDVLWPWLSHDSVSKGLIHRGAGSPALDRLRSAESDCCRSAKLGVIHKVKTTMSCKWGVNLLKSK